MIGALQALAPDNVGKTGAAYIVYGAPALVGATIDLANPQASGLHMTTFMATPSRLRRRLGSLLRHKQRRQSELFIGSPERTFEVNGEEREDTGVTELIYGQCDFLPE